MTETLLNRAITWQEAQLGLWVAKSSDSRPLGIVAEKWVHGFVVTGRTGKNLGSYPSLEEAKAALEASL
ncbi:hypothetical protein N1027_02515 [Herbiconiux sp. CPCC 205763]|uniref:Uncharacterized protein n=1 Tax=Herbiconiux aconitum TaxID=2970913 RepID=A0ABT2GNX6_9MICO|nr:hypothetical protein [Herbiconiux aconitum]MCS5717000.1 hypothetical protein [Herbiconiux aconitum]